MPATTTKQPTEADAQRQLAEADRAVKDAEANLIQLRVVRANALARAQSFHWQRQAEGQAAIEAERQALRTEAVKLAKRERLAPLDMQIKRMEAELPTHQEAGNVAGVEALKKLITETKQRRTALANA